MEKTKLYTVVFLLSVVTMLSAIQPIQVVTRSNNGIMLRFKAPETKLESEAIQNEMFQNVSMEGAESKAQDGYPALPVFSTSLILPPSGGYRLNVRYGAVKTIADVRPMPIFASEEDKHSLRYNRSAYQSKDAVDFNIVESSPVSIIRDFRVVQLNINPAYWTPNNSVLSVYQDIELDIEFTSDNNEISVPPYTSYSKAFEKIYEANLLNFDEYRNILSPNMTPKILIVHGNYTNTTFSAKLNDFMNWKRQKGFKVSTVSTSVTGTSNTAIKNYFQSQYDNIDSRPDYIILIGDTVGSFPIPTWVETISSYSGEGDYPYTFLNGGDMLGDVLIGRISAETVEQLSIIFSKIYSYERDVNNSPADAGWFNRMLLIGDPSSSGVSCIYTNLYVKELAQRANPNYSFIENYSSGFSTTINSGINQGVGFFNYRGFSGMSGWSPTTSLVNNPRFPHAVILTCNTGNFASSSSAGTSEKLIRLGTSANPTGAVTATGMATGGTHTMFNNLLTSAIFNSIFSLNMRTMGEAVFNAKMNINKVYGVSHSNQAKYFAHWCNLMGDPSMEVFVGIPKSLVINYNSSLPLGSTIIDVQVTNENAACVENVTVTAYSNTLNTVVASGYTDEFGRVSLNIENGVSSELLLTASKHDYKPSQFTVNVGQGGIVYHSKAVFDNGMHGSQGNSDAVASAGETIAILLSVKNTSNQSIASLTGVATTSDPDVSILSGVFSFGELSPNGVQQSTNAILLSINNSITPFHDIRLNVNITDNLGSQHNFPVHVLAYNASLSIEGYTISAGGNNVLDPAESGLLQLSIRNESSTAISNIWAEISSMNDLVIVTDSLSFVGSIAPFSFTNSTDGFAIFARSSLIPGMQIPIKVRLFHDSGFEQFAIFNITIGTVSQNTPLGPDAYGYFIYDQTDTGFSDCPVYDWIEINPNLGGSGTRLSTLIDSGISSDEGDQTGSNVVEAVNLPFIFPFYGINYSQITVCVNGFITLGITQNGEFRNSRIPGGQGPSPMIAAFWDDLILSSDSGIYKYYDAANSRFIIEYSKMRNGFDRVSVETFQVIFYDPQVYPTSMGDGIIKIQYKDFNNIDVGGIGSPPRHGNYCTIGIKDHTNTRGLEYTFNNQYAPAAAPLSSLKSILITTMPVLHESAYLIVQKVIVGDTNGNSILEPGETAEIGIRLMNQGVNPASNVSISATLENNPYVQLSVSNSGYPNILGDQAQVNMNALMLSVASHCPDNTPINLSLLVTCNAGQWFYPLTLIVKKPSIGVSNYCISDTEGNSNGLVEPGELIQLVVNYANNSNIDARNVVSSLISASGSVSILNPTFNIPVIPAGCIHQAVHNIQVSASALLGSSIPIQISFTGDHIPNQNEQISLTLGVAGMNESFETTNGNFVASPTSNGWEWGIANFPGAHSGTRVWGTRLTSQYPANASYMLTTPSVYIGSNSFLEFWHRYSTEATYDGGNVKISTDNGSNWTVIQPVGGYTDGLLSSLNGPGFSGNNGSWQLVRFSLSSYSFQNVRFRFTFASDQIVNGEGWFIDDVMTSGFMEFAGKLNGYVQTNLLHPDYESVLIKSNTSICTHPNQQGNFELFLPMGSHSVTAISAGFTDCLVSGLQLSVNNPITSTEFFMAYLPPVRNYNVSNVSSTAIMSWNAPLNPLYPVTGYSIYQRYGAGAFEKIAVVADTTYTQHLQYNGIYQYYVSAEYSSGSSLPSLVVTFINSGAVDVHSEDIPQVTTKLSSVYPNPFNPSTSIAFGISTNDRVKLSVYNLKGQCVRTLLDDFMVQGNHTVVWNGTDRTNTPVSSGVYFIRMEAQGNSFVKRAILMK